MNTYYILNTFNSPFEMVLDIHGIMLTWKTRSKAKNWAKKNLRGYYFIFAWPEEK